jgi:5-methylthioadenosine/S-adenosylhomocysteine deaminase
VIENGAVAIRGDRIVAVGSRPEIERLYRARQRLDRPDGLIAPGLINAHTHAPMSLLRGIADDLRLQDWLEKYIFPAEKKNLSPDFVRWGTRLALLEMLLSGTTTYADMYYFEDIIAEETKQAGMRGVLGETIIGFPVADAKTPDEALRFTESYIQRFRNDPLIVPAVAPHALYTNSEQTLKASRALADRYGVPLITHLAETKRERDDAIAKYGKSPVQVLDSWGVLAGRTLAAHCVWLDDADIVTLGARYVAVAHCPSSNMKLASGVAPIVKMQDAAVTIGLGTDGPAGSNNDLDLMEEIDLAAKLAKITKMSPLALNARAVVEMATIDGARALHMEKEIGSLEQGKKADLILIGLDEPNAVPMYDVYAQIAYALKASDVETVVIGGRTVMRDHKLLTVDEQAAIAKAREYKKTVAASLGME